MNEARSVYEFPIPEQRIDVAHQARVTADIEAAMRPSNPTGIHPTEFKLLVRPKAAEEITKGGIIIPSTELDKQKFAQTEGVVIAVSPLAFTYAKQEEWEAAGSKPPQPGQTVLYARHAGNWVKGKDGGEYLLINDKDVGAIIE